MLPGHNGLEQYKKTLKYCDYDDNCTETLCPIVKVASETP